MAKPYFTHKVHFTNPARDFHKSVILSSEIFDDAEYEIIYSVNCEISHAAFGFVRCEMKFAHIRVSEYHLDEVQISLRSNITRRRRIELKKALVFASAFFLAPPLKTK